MSRHLEVHPNCKSVLLQCGCNCNVVLLHFLWAEKCKPIEIHRQLNEVYGGKTLFRQAFAKCCDLFENGCSEIEDGCRQGRPSMVKFNVFNN